MNRPSMEDEEMFRAWIYTSLPAHLKGYDALAEAYLAGLQAGRAQERITLLAEIEQAYRINPRDNAPEDCEFNNG